MTLPGARTTRLQRMLLGLAMASLALAAMAVDPRVQISQHGHVAWRTQAGDLPGMPMALAQGPDGYLWIGTLNGLVRFDGVRFTRWHALEGKQLPSEGVTRLLATPDGSLWIGTTQGLARWAKGRLDNYSPAPGGAIMSITQDRQGAVWVTRTARPDSKELVCRVSVENTMECFGDAEGLTLPNDPCCPAGFYTDATGTAWIGTDSTLTMWRQRASTHIELPLNLTRKDMGVTAVVPGPGGALWVGMAKPGKGLGLQLLVGGAFAPFESTGMDPTTLEVSTLLRDRHDALWIGTYGQGLYRLYAGRMDHFGATDGLTSDKINALFEDREGNLWVATAKGIDQFRALRVTSFGKRQGLADDSAATVAAAADGSIWIGSQGLNVLRDSQVAAISKEDGLPEGQVTDILQDHAGHMWVGVDRTLWKFVDGTFRPVRNASGSTDIAYIRSLVQDAQRDVWGLSNKSIFRFRDDELVEELPLGPELEGRQLVADRRAGIWLGLRSGGLARLREDKVEVFDVALSPGASVNGFVAHMATTPSGAVLGATANGIVIWKDQKARLLSAADGLPCNPAHALAHDREGDLWAYMQCGLVEIPRAQLERWWAGSEPLQQVRLFDALDGVDAGWAPFRGATISPDGRLWFASGRGVQLIDPAGAARNTVAPQVHIEALVADRRSHETGSVVELPPRTKDLRIDYTATSFVLPQRVRFRYKLLGRDTDWQAPVNRRQAFYTDLGPGNYEFVVIASNDDGVWNERGDSLSFCILPAWHQTLVFRVAAVLLGVLLAGWLYAWRVRRLSAALTARFDERLAERLRIARDLHDTLLQTIQAGKLVADDALAPAVDESRRRHALERISHWLAAAITEGRAALNAMRQSAALGNDLAEAFQQAAEECSEKLGIAVRVAVVGRPREMHPIVRDEIYRIGYEAIRNAATHSKGAVLEVELTYARDLTLSVRDDGVGLGASEVDKSGHFGIQGMRERAQRIGARLSVLRPLAGGTEIRLWVPGRSVFR